MRPKPRCLSEANGAATMNCSIMSQLATPSLDSSFIDRNKEIMARYGNVPSEILHLTLLVDLYLLINTEIVQPQRLANILYYNKQPHSLFRVKLKQIITKKCQTLPINLFTSVQ